MLLSTDVTHFPADDVWTDLEATLGCRGQVLAEAGGVGHPHLLKDEAGRYSCIVEGKRVAVVEGCGDALILFIACHSVFNLKFGRGARGFGVYMQRQLGIDDGQKLTARAVKYTRAAAP